MRFQVRMVISWGRRPQREPIYGISLQREPRRSYFYSNHDRPRLIWPVRVLLMSPPPSTVVFYRWIYCSIWIRIWVTIIDLNSTKGICYDHEKCLWQVMLRKKVKVYDCMSWKSILRKCLCLKFYASWKCLWKCLCLSSCIFMKTIF